MAFQWPSTPQTPIGAYTSSPSQNRTIRTHGTLPSQPTWQAPQGYMQGGNWMTGEQSRDRLVNQAMWQNAPAFAQLNMANENLDAKGRLQQASNAASAQGLRDDSRFGLADVGARQRGLGYDLTREKLEPDFYGREYGLDMRTAQNQELRAKDAFGTGLAELNEQASAAGSMVTTGARRREGDLRKLLARNIEDVQIARSGAGLKRDRSAADHARAMGQLSVQGERLGIEADRLRAGVDNALKKLGLSGQIDALDLAEAKISNNLAAIQGQNEIWNAVMKEIADTGGMNSPLLGTRGSKPTSTTGYKYGKGGVK